MSIISVLCLKNDLEDVNYFRIAVLGVIFV